MEWTREYTPSEVAELEAAARAHHEMVGGLSSYVDECQDASAALDARRREHERRFRRTRVAARPATRDQMIAYIEAVGATDVTTSPDLVHVPVAPVAGGIAFAPRRMTISNLEEVYYRLKNVAPAEGRVVDRVQAIIDSNPTGVRMKDLQERSGASRTSIQRAVAMLELHQLIAVRREPTRPGGTPRLRYFPANTVFSGAESLDPALEMGVI